MSTILSAVTALGWPHDWVQENRDPLLTFSTGSSDDTQVYGFYLFSIAMWIELLTLMVGNMLLASLFAIAVYYTTVRKAPRQGYSSTLSLLLTFGVFLPLWIFAPKTVLDNMQVQNKLFRFCLCVVTPTTSIFRLLEAYFGFTPQHATRSLGDFCFYMGSPLIVKFDTKTQTYVRSTTQSTTKHLSRFLVLLLTTGLYQSMFLAISSFPKFGRPAKDDYYDLRYVVDPATWKETALYAILLQQYLTTFGEGLMFATNLLAGVQTEKRKWIRWMQSLRWVFLLSLLTVSSFCVSHAESNV